MGKKIGIECISLILSGDEKCCHRIILEEVLLQRRGDTNKWGFPCGNEPPDERDRMF